MTLPKAGELIQLDSRRGAKTHTNTEGVKLLQVRLQMIRVARLLYRSFGLTRLIACSGMSSAATNWKRL